MRVFLVNFAYEMDLTESELTMESMLDTGIAFSSLEVAKQAIINHANSHRLTEPLKEVENPVESRRGIEHLFSCRDRTSGEVRYCIVEKAVHEDPDPDAFQFFGYGL